MAVGYIPSLDEDKLVMANPAYQQQQQQQQQQPTPQQQQQPAAGANMSQQVCDELKRQHLMVLFHEILMAYSRQAVLAQQEATSVPAEPSPPSPPPCLMCKKLYYLFRRTY